MSEQKISRVPKKTQNSDFTTQKRVLEKYKLLSESEKLWILGNINGLLIAKQKEVS